MLRFTEFCEAVEDQEVLDEIRESKRKRLASNYRLCPKCNGKDYKDAKTSDCSYCQGAGSVHHTKAKLPGSQYAGRGSHKGVNEDQQEGLERSGGLTREENIHESDDHDIHVEYQNQGRAKGKYKVHAIAAGASKSMTHKVGDHLDKDGADSYHYTGPEVHFKEANEKIDSERKGYGKKDDRKQRARKVRRRIDQRKVEIADYPQDVIPASSTIADSK